MHLGTIMFEPATIIALLGNLGGLVAIWMRLETRLTRVETQIEDVKANCTLQCHRDRNGLRP